MAGQSTTTLPLAATVGHVLGLSDGSTVRQKTSDLALQLLTSPEFAALIANSALFQGEWNASAGNFPSGAQKGMFWRVGTAGTVDGVAFVVSDILLALIDDASTTTYAASWHRAAHQSFDHTHSITDVTGLSAELAAQGGKADSALQPADVAPAARATAQPAVSYGSLALFESAIAGGLTVPDGTMAFVQRSGTTIAILKATSGAPAVVDEAPAGWAQFMLLGG